MKEGKRKLKTTTTWFQSGHMPYNKGIKQMELKSQESSDKKSVRYNRPTNTEMSTVQNNLVVSGENFSYGFVRVTF